jgi:hypothetical protein
MMVNNLIFIFVSFLGFAQNKLLNDSDDREHEFIQQGIKASSSSNKTYRMIDCPIVGDVATLVYYLPDSAWYDQMLYVTRINPTTLNRICFDNELEAKNSRTSACPVDSKGQVKKCSNNQRKIRRFIKSKA